MSAWTSALAPTSMPRVGSSKISTAGFMSSHLASITFCWLPPERSPTGVEQRRRADPQTAAVDLGGRRSARRSMSRQRLSELAQAGQGDVRRHRLRQREAEPAAILGDVGDAVRHGVPWRADVDLDAVAPDHAGVGGRRRRTAPRRSRSGRSRRARRTRAPRRARTSKRDVVEVALRGRGPRRSSATSPGSWATRRKKSASSRPTMSRISVTSVTSATGRVEMCRPSRSTVMRSLSSNTSSRRWLTKRIATPDAASRRTWRNSRLHLVRRQRGGRLVHDQDADVAGHRLGDLDRLLAGDGELRRRRPRVDVDLEAGEDRRRPLLHRRASARASPPVWPMKMFSDDGEVGEDERFLVDAGDAQRLGVGRAAQLDDLAVDLEVAGVGPVQPGHDLDQRRLAGAVLADEGVDLARPQVERHAAQGVGRAEALRHVDDRHERTIVASPVPSRTPQRIESFQSLRGTHAPRQSSVLQITSDVAQRRRPRLAGAVAGTAPRCGSHGSARRTTARPAAIDSEALCLGQGQLGGRLPAELDDDGATGGGRVEGAQGPEPPVHCAGAPSICAYSASHRSWYCRGVSRLPASGRGTRSYSSHAERGRCTTSRGSPTRRRRCVRGSPSPAPPPWRPAPAAGRRRHGGSPP